MTSLLYANVSPNPVGVAVWLNGQWWNWTAKKWESPFTEASHLLMAVPSSDFPAFQTLVVPLGNVPAGATLLDFVVVGGTTTPNSTIPLPDNYLPGSMRGTLQVVF